MITNDSEISDFFFHLQNKTEKLSLYLLVLPISIIRSKAYSLNVSLMSKPIGFPWRTENLMSEQSAQVSTKRFNTLIYN